MGVVHENGGVESSRVEPLKVHRGHVALDGREFTVLTLRASTACRFATNRYHETWHVLSDVSGARLLGRLCWALAFQRRPNSIITIDRPHLVPNPFDADPSSPIVIANTDLAPINRAVISQLKSFLDRKRRSDGTVRLSTAGLDRLLANDPATALLAEQRRSGAFWNEHQRRGWTDRVNGVVVMAAPAPTLQWWAVWLSGLGSHWYAGSDYSELCAGSTPRRGEGEVQVFQHFRTMVDTAIETRERLFPGTIGRELLEHERLAVWTALPTSS